MADELTSLIQALGDTDTYDRENALIAVYIFLKNQICFLPSPSNTFMELSQWRDCSLSDGVASYDERKSDDELLKIEETIRKNSNQNICKT